MELKKRSLVRLHSLWYILGRKGEEVVLLYIYVFVTGIVLGSFYIVVAFRVPRGESIITPRSYCPHCQHRLRPKELIPILSFCMQKGRCTHCKRKISYTYPIVELITGSLFLISVCIVGVGQELIVIWTLFSLLVMITLTDLFYMMIPNAVLLSFSCIFLIEYMVSPFIFWFDSVLGGGIIFCVLYALRMIHPNGLGGGDVKLLSLLGFVLGIKGILITLCIASCSSLFFLGICFLFKRMNLRDPLPFGPFIALGTICYVAMKFWE